MNLKFWRAACIAASIILFLVSPVVAAPKTLLGHVPEAARKLTPLGQLPATNQLNLAIGLPLRDPAGLDRFLADVYNPASPNYRKFLTPEEFTVRFSATEADYAAVKNFALTNGFKISGEHGNRLLLDVTARAADAARAFHFKLNKFKHPTEAREFFAPDAEPTVDAALAVVDIQGLSDYSRPQPRLKRTDLKIIAPKNGSAPDGSSYFGDDFRNAYALGAALTGAGQQVGLLQFDGYYASDIAAYATAAGGGRSSIVIQTVLTDSYNGTPTTGANSGNGEVSLDIEMAMAMAPGLSKIVVFEASPTGGNANTIFAAMVTNTAIKQFSCSWGWSGGVNTTTENYFKQMASQGQSFFNASGDSDAFLSGQIDDPNQTTYPSGSPNITQVGGTTLTMNGTGASYASETVWNRGYVARDGQYEGSSGGISSNAIPVWQQGISMAANGGSATTRNVPDVALTAESCYVKYGNGTNSSFGGTSCAAPLWAGFMALVNQQLVAASGVATNSAGFINPAIYTLAEGSYYAACFHDIVTGNNFWSSSPSLFYATNGYDLCTGLGTPFGGNLINALTGSLVVSPASGFTSAGPVGGLFNVTSQNFMLTNMGAVSLRWGVVNTSSWLNVSSTVGTLAAAGQTNLTASLTVAANALAAGIYSVNVLVTNQTGVNIPLAFTLQVGQPLVQNGGFETGTFTGWTETGSTTYMSVSTTSTYIHSGTHGADLGPLGAVSYLSQNLVTTPGSSYLLSFWLKNPKGGTGNQFLAQWNGATIFYQTNITTTTWTNLQFVVTATGSTTPLQFGFQNNPDYFGFDDITVTYIPVPFVNVVSKKTNTFTLAWNTLPGVVYQVQYQTNLLNTNWPVLSNITAVASSTSFTNTTGSDQQRYYRIRRLP